MKHTDYSRQLTVSASPEQVYQALSRDIGVWWGNSNEGVTSVGDTVTIGFEENPSQWTFEALELMEAKRVVLVCIESDHHHEGLPGTIQHEWLGTQLIWQINEDDAGTHIEFTHQGLTPELTCYDVCQSGWNHYFGEGLCEHLRLTR